MHTNLDQTVKTVAAQVFMIQAVLAVDPSNPKWSDVSWTAFKKESKRLGPDYFIHSKEGKTFLNHVDRPKHYYGERFWTDVPAFMTLETARACEMAIVRGGWSNGRELRITKQSFAASLEKVT